MFRFEKLDIWKKSIEFANLIYKSTETFPMKEQFGLTSQMRRAAVSISANIAEGSSRVSNKDFSRFIEIAYGSLCETLSHLHIATAQSLIDVNCLERIVSEADELARMLSSFRNSLGKWKTDQVASE
ncbi:four helix bundle protein [bacterium]|nr:four helix bundle protein [bacterium]